MLYQLQSQRDLVQELAAILRGSQANFARIGVALNVILSNTVTTTVLHSSTLRSIEYACKYYLIIHDAKIKYDVIGRQKLKQNKHE